MRLRDIVCKLPDKDDMTFFLKALADKIRIPYSKIIELYRFFGKGFFIFFYLLSGKTISFPKIRFFHELNLMIDIHKKLKKLMNECNMDFNEAISKCAKDYHITEDKAYKLYKDYRMQDKKCVGLEKVEVVREKGKKIDLM